MTLNNSIEIARRNLERASEELGFDVETPYTIKKHNTERGIFAFLPRLGSRNGMYLELTGSPEFQIDPELFKIAKERGIFCSFINLESILEYRKDVFEDAITDWTVL